MMEDIDANSGARSLQILLVTGGVESKPWKLEVTVSVFRKFAGVGASEASALVLEHHRKSAGLIRRRTRPHRYMVDVTHGTEGL